MAGVGDEDCDADDVSGVVVPGVDVMSVKTPLTL